MLLIPPNYCLRLRIYHPEANPDDIKNRLGLTPQRSWMVGSQRNTPKGTPLEGLNKETYWSHSFETTEEIGPNEFLNRVFRTLIPNSEFFETIFNTGGRAEIYFTIRTGENAGETIKWATLEHFVKLKIDFSIELFP